MTDTFYAISFIWSSLGVLLALLYSIDLIRFDHAIKTPGKRLVFRIIITILGGPVIVVVTVGAVLLYAFVEIIIFPIGRWILRKLNPVRKWFLS
jgi:hypothetical protein